MRKINLLLLLLVLTGTSVYAQSTTRQSKKDDKEKKKLQRISLFKELEEGENLYQREFSMGGRLNTNGWTGFVEMAYRKNRNNVRYFQLEFSEVKHAKQEKMTTIESDGYFLYSTRPFFYGKQNNFYPVNLGYGNRKLIGGKANKQGVEVQGIYYGGISLGLLKPYYIEVRDMGNGQRGDIRYTPATADKFLDESLISGGAGFGKGWDELTLIPGLHGKLGIRFDWARFNHVVSALEVGVNGAFYTKKVPIMVLEDNKQFLLNAYVGLQFGKRWNK
ncbi:hypothetical protein LX64_03528 [Chitinophaga skermanii]|uniref:Outer membrane protein with beta-barrel domain n=1 Tax=Chitinophaga skermanii TaxID=331697 RepID=A0A327QD63_9BACT|nr:hypothetical protein [Chitinophaga skermanii]RAJ02509.1 hypothetical protein LX64_03528 [Chitinophaga skermanii]